MNENECGKKKSLDEEKQTKNIDKESEEKAKIRRGTKMFISQ